MTATKTWCDLPNILARHALWVTNSAGGLRASLEGANLEGANLEGANLKDANLAGVNLEGANLKYANLAGANLEGANLASAHLEGVNLAGVNLKYANLKYASLAGVNLEGANLKYANLAGANLEGANLASAHLEGANLEGANLEGANLEGANLKYANLEGANLKYAKLPMFQLSAETLIVWKKAYRNKGKNRAVLVQLEIGANVKRTASLVGRKCRSESALVLDILPWPPVLNASDAKITQAIAFRDDTVYVVGKCVVADSYDPDPRIECTHGIHWFATREEAEAYDG